MNWKPGYLELGMMQAIIYILVWFWDQYIASFVTIVFPGLFSAVLLVSIIAEWIEPSKVPRAYFLHLILAICIPLVIGGFFYFIYEGSFDWMEGI